MNSKFSVEDYIDSVSKASGTCLNVDDGPLAWEGLDIFIRTSLGRSEQSVKEWKENHEYGTQFSYRDFSKVRDLNDNYVQDVINSEFSLWVDLSEITK